MDCLVRMFEWFCVGPPLADRCQRTGGGVGVPGNDHALSDDDAVVGITIVFLLWSANIWIFGMKHARNLTLKNAAITVGVPVGIYIIYQIVSLGVI